MFRKKRKKNIIVLPPFKYQFVHIPKTGGTCIEDAIEMNYTDKFVYKKPHALKCVNNEISITILRDPYERFISMFKYWKSGSDLRSRPDDFVEKYGEYTIKDYINLLKVDSPALTRAFTWDFHYAPATFWINNTNYKKIIIIKYCSDLDRKFKKLLTLLRIKDKQVPVPKTNVSTIKSEIILDEEDKAYIRKRFAGDFRLWYLANNMPHLFGGVL